MVARFKLNEPKNINLIPAFVVGATAVGTLALVLNVGQYFWLAQLANQKPPTLVELTDGTSVRVMPIGALERDPEAVKQFVKSTVTETFNWTGTLPQTNPQEPPRPDPGVSLQNNTNKITTATWQRGWAYSETFRRSFLEKIAQLTPQDIFRGGGTQVRLVPTNVEGLEQIAPAKWKISYVGNLLFFRNGDNLGKAMSFKKDVYVEAIEPPVLPDNPSPLDLAIYNARKDGLEIYSMPDLNLGNNFDQ